MDREKLAARLLATFISELEEQVSAASQALATLQGTPGDAESQRALFRVMHTLKGAARAASVPAVEASCHRLEALLAHARDERRALTPEELDVLVTGVYALGIAGEQLQRGTTAERASGIPAAPSAGPAAAPARAPANGAAASSGELPEPRAVTADLRVRAERLDELLAASSRMVVATGRLRALRSDLETVSANTALALRIARVRGTAAEATHALLGLQKESARLALAAAEVSRDIEHVAGDVASGVRELRMRAFGDVVRALPGTLRDAAAATGREARLEVRGEQVEAERAVLEQVLEALRHLVRNAVAHGIEPPKTRVASGKPAQGVVRVAASLVGDRLIVTVSDDGAGLDMPAIRERLARRGDAVPDSDREAARLLFQGGISTHDAADAIAGRGVGLDAVREAMSSVHGSVDVAWRAGEGATFTIEAPVSLGTQRAMLVQVTGQTIALPTAYIERAQRVNARDIRLVDGREMLPTADAPVPVVSLAALLGPPLAERRADEFAHAVMLAAGNARLLVVVDELLGEEEVIVRPIHAGVAAGLPHLAGAALLPSGRVALVANVVHLLSGSHGTSERTQLLVRDAEASVAKRRRILVADDSVTTRTLEQSVLEAAGFDVDTAVDGADAWRILQDRGADLLVSDVDMPQMDGFTLCATARSSPQFRALPVVLVTALEQPEDRARGLEAGADAYLSKSNFDQETLLDTIRRLLD